MKDIKVIATEYVYDNNNRLVEQVYNGRIIQILNPSLGEENYVAIVVCGDGKVRSVNIGSLLVVD